MKKNFYVDVCKNGKHKDVYFDEESMARNYFRKAIDENTVFTKNKPDPVVITLYSYNVKVFGIHFGKILERTSM